ncbi:LEAF RUST 10 DISEASE-RESISTANCE LOCUS RECEPTOR-LIKE PROTEIN KINASE-like 2.1 isoform X2 [Carya illinoinensis]|nr:LEAF RUST 10 DISEASE-RESISTANCE LOCUS RECEPTOR-LIKE PROTEIN KINASE-like 2.1 isoform X2 [Carya illinoinensis]
MRPKNLFPTIFPMLNLCIFLILSSLLPRKSQGVVNPYFQVCSAEPETCGDGQPIKFPFHIRNKQNRSCGYPGFELSCNYHGQPTINIQNNDYIIHNISYETQTLRVSNSDFWNSNNGCIPLTQNISLPGARFELAPFQTHVNLLFGCNASTLESTSRFSYPGCNHGENKNSSVLALPENDPKLRNVSKACTTRVVAPVLEPYERENGDGIEGVLRNGFRVKWKASECSSSQESGGRCGFNYSEWHFKCFCPDRPHAWHCISGENKQKWMIPLVILSIGNIGATIVVIICYLRRKFPYFWKKKSVSHQNIEDFLKSVGPLVIRRYSYSDIKKMTNIFKEKLGQGGYGSVFKGKLQDGCLVAVKILKESRENGEEFVNEVASISRTSHVNIVTLMGFCFEGSNRALVYEFMPNGSLEKFIYKEYPSKADHQLEWKTLYNIAVGIARGLEYLHKGCNARILHFDIKPHNILLDKSYHPKISDFGLAKICSREESIISMLGTRGTIGYIAPEVFNRNFGGISHKSDVYSYGMMILEIVGGRKNIDIEGDRTSEIHIPHWIYKRLELDEDLSLQGLVMNEEDRKSAKKMIIVGLWCIQIDPSNRPTMGRVVDMLEGSSEYLQVPPKPFLSSSS